MSKLPLTFAITLVYSVFACGQAMAASDDVDARAGEILSGMTLEEKIGQLAQCPDWIKDDVVMEERAGSFLNVTSTDQRERLQHLAVEKTRTHIPLMFGRDVIHGFRTIFPIPLGQACTWDPDAVRQAAMVSALEAAAAGYNWTFAPMVDLARDPRWGRIAEGFGEDPWLASRMAEAMVEGFQSPQPGLPHGIAACVKHFAAYGAAEGGRDYSETSVPERELRDFYLRPFEAAVNAGALTFMSAFSDIDGVPSSCNHFLLEDVLRGEWGFRGFVVSDWRSIWELQAHGVAADETEAAKLAILAGVDEEMVSTTYNDHLKDLIESGEVPESVLDRRVLAILRVKLELGLFDNPYMPDLPASVMLSQEHLDLARKVAQESAVLLKNDGDLLPLKKGVKVAVIGPLANAPHEQMGTWAPDGQDGDNVTPLAALREKLGAENVIYALGLAYSRDESEKGFQEAVDVAGSADVVLFFAGEESLLSGEAHCMSDIRLPGAQEKLAHALAATGRPVVMVIMSGRPNVITDVIGDMDAVLVAFHQGTMAGPALADLIFGDVSPSGRLPVSWPVSVGQIPLFYNHKNSGRPFVSESFTPISEIPQGEKQTSLGNTAGYLDVTPHPLFPFGYGLTYGDFEYSDLQLSARKMPVDGSIEASVTLKNKGAHAATEVVQLYIRDLVASISQPVRELKGFQRIYLAPGASQRVSFTLNAADLNFTDIDMNRVVEPGAFKLWIGPDAASGLEGGFDVE